MVMFTVNVTCSCLGSIAVLFLREAACRAITKHLNNYHRHEENILVKMLARLLGLYIQY